MDRNFLIRPYREGEEIAEWFDNTRLSGLHGCAHWGMVRYILNKSMHEPSRSLPLECGSAMHEALAVAMCTRLMNSKHYTIAFERAYNIINNVDRWNANGDYAVGDRAICTYVTEGDAEGAALATLYSSTYYDDPSDAKRTIANMETSLIYALSAVDHVPAVINGKVCVELPIKFVIEYGDKAYVYNGRGDAIVATPNGYGPLDWKTSSQLSTGWENQWHLAHQMTGYCAGIAMDMGQPVNDGYVVGIQIPLARDTYKSVRDVHFVRQEHQFESWINYVLDGIDIYERFKDRPFEATKRSDYCYRFFRMCQFAEMCSAEPDLIEQFREELVIVEWHPEDE